MTDAANAFSMVLQRLAAFTKRIVAALVGSGAEAIE
jgi:hypothetical protein